MDYKELSHRLRRRYLDSLGNVVLQKPSDVYSDCNQAASAITDLLARAKAAERDRDNLREAMKLNCLMCDSMHPDNRNCTEVGGFCTAVPAAHCPLIPRLMEENGTLKDLLKATEARAEKAERERDAAIKDMSGICYLCKNAKPYSLLSKTVMTCKQKKAASTKKPGCKYFKWRGQKEE